MPSSCPLSSRTPREAQALVRKRTSRNFWILALRSASEDMEGPRERARHHRGLALALSVSQGLRLGTLRQRLRGYRMRRSSRPSPTRSRYRIAMLIPTRHRQSARADRTATLTVASGLLLVLGLFGRAAR